MEAVFTVSADGRVAGWSEAAARLTGWSAEEAAGAEATRFFTGAPAAGVVEGWLVRRGGEQVRARAEFIALGARGGFVGVLSEAGPQHDREHLLAAMESQRRLFEMVLEHAPAGIAIFDGGTLRVKWANATFRGALEEPWRSMDVRGARLEDLLPNAGESGMAAIFRRVAENREPYFDPEFALAGMSRAPAYLRVSLLPLEAESDGPPDVMVLLTDVTAPVEARKRVEELNRELEERNREVERANRLKSEFLAGMSHELRTPLHTIIGFSDLLAKGNAGPLNAKQARQVERIQQGARHLLSLINDVLDLSKIEAGRVELRPETFVAAGAVGEALGAIAPLAAVRQVRMASEVAPGLVLRADRLRFRQILDNLLSNAVKFTPAGGSVVVSAGEAGGWAEVAVADTGIGIAKQDQEAIFDEFRQVGVTTRGVREGTGLGLAITARLVRLHGGTIRVESAPGKGSRFTVRLPLGAEPGAPEESGAAEAGRPGAAAAAGHTILIADDSAEAREWARDVFEARGFRVVEARDGEEALAAIRASAPDIVLMDIQMPGMDGYAVLARLRQEARFARLPVIAVTAFAMRSDRERALAAGFDAYVSKPVDAEALERQVAALVGR